MVQPEGDESDHAAADGRHAATSAPQRDGRVLLPALGLALGAAVALGLARFSYSLLLPPMQADLGWNYAQAGMLNTANAVGYLVGAIAAAAVGRAFGTRRSVAGGMVVAIVALAAAAFTPNFALQLLLRLVAGFGSALTFVGGAALVAKLGDRSPRRSGLLLSLYTGGAGIGILVSGLLVPPLLAIHGPTGWHAGWIGLAILAAASLAAVVPALRGVPDPDPPQPSTSDAHRSGVLRPLLLPGFGYLLYGAGYIAYMTFVVSYLADDGFSRGQVTLFWTVLGASVVAGVPVWGRVLDRLRSGYALALLNIALVAGAVLALAASGMVAGMASAVVFGSAFMAVPAGMAHVARRRLPSSAWAAGISAVTSAFAIGQSIGPGLAGILSDSEGGAGIGLVVAMILLGTATLVYLLVELAASRRRPVTEQPEPAFAVD